MSASDESALDGAGAEAMPAPARAATRQRLGAGTLAAARDVNRHHAERIERLHARLLPPDPAEDADAAR